jgi:branched-chain amino acid transport system permease protein
MIRNAMEAISEDEDAAARGGHQCDCGEVEDHSNQRRNDRVRRRALLPVSDVHLPDTVSGISVSLQMVFAAVVVAGIYVALARLSAPSSPSCSPKHCVSASALKPSDGTI